MNREYGIGVAATHTGHIGRGVAASHTQCTHRERGGSLRTHSVHIGRGVASAHISNKVARASAHFSNKVARATALLSLGLTVWEPPRSRCTKCVSGSHPDPDVLSV